MPRFFKERKNVLILAGLLFGQALLLSLQVPLGDAPSVFEKAAFAVLAPVQRAVAAVGRGVGSLWSGYIGLRRVHERNQVLQEEADRLRLENILLRQGLSRLAEREAAAAFLGSVGRAFVLASVIGLDASNPHKSVVIDIGSDRGLGSNSPVLDSQGRLVGRVIPPFGRTEATVQLITDNGSSVGVITESSRVLGVFDGDGTSGRGWLKYVRSTNETVLESEILLTSGLDRVFPAGLRVGTILTVRSDTSLFKRIAVEPFFEIRDLRVVAVLLGGGRDAGEAR
ncbi:MAG: rod shape-determining protein MreC [Candidatus Aminicenantes bacterium]|nr:rod shape-determining protein MreC [Candidatus Aminicenantes bacterium]